MILTYLGLLIIISYTIIMIVKNKSIPSSLSETYYLGAGNWFTIVLFVSGFLVTSGLLTLSEGRNFQFLSFFVGSGLLLVGAAPKFKDGEKTVHTVGASVLLTASQLWIAIFSTPYVLLSWLVMCWLGQTRQRIFWLEMLCLFNVAIGLMFI